MGEEAPPVSVIEVRDLHTRFGTAVVHDGVSLEVREGELFALAGASGCGKPTLLREIILLQQPQSWSVRVFGREVIGLDDEEALLLRHNWEIALDREDPQRVRLVLAIERGVPIKQDTVAILGVQGLTGIAFLDLEGDPGSRRSSPERKGSRTV